MNLSKKRKAQVQIFEAVLIFGISVSIFTICYFLFSSYHAYFSNVTIHDQLDGVKELAVANMLQLAEKENDIDHSSVSVSIPKRIIDIPYEIILYEDRLCIESLRASQCSNIFNIESVQFQPSKAASVNGKITIYKKGNRIYIV